MAAPKQNISMSALGDLYSFLFENAVDASKKKGPNAVPDLVTSQISDGVAEGILGLGASIAGIASPDGAKSVVDYLQKDLFTSPLLTINPKGDGWAPNTANWTNILGTGDGVPVIFPGEGKEVKSWIIDNQEGVAIEGTPALVNDVLLKGPAPYADALVAGWWEKKKREDTMKFWAGLIDPYSKEAPERLMAMAGLSGTVSERIGAGVIADIFVNGIDKDIAAAKAVARQDKINTEERAAMANKSGMYDYDSAIATMMGMVFGITDRKDRDEFGTVYSAQMRKDLIAQYNAIAGTTYKENEFAKMFAGLHAMNNTTLFAPGGVGTNMQTAFWNTMNAYSVDPNQSAKIRANSARIQGNLGNQVYFGDLLRKVSTAVDSSRPGGRDARDLLKMGMGQVEAELRGTAVPANISKANRLRASQAGLPASDELSKFDAWRTRTANTVAYGIYRWQTMPSINKIFSPIGLLTGKSWNDLANWGGGLRGYSIGKQSPITISGIDPKKANTQVFGSYGLSRNIFTLSYKANNFQKFAYRMQQFAPLGAAMGILNGDYFQRQLWIGTNFGEKLKDSTTKAGWSASAKRAFDLLEGKKWYSKAYLAMARGTNAIRFIVNAPQIMVEYAFLGIETLRKQAEALAKKAAQSIGEKLLGTAFGQFLGWLTAGVFTAMQWAYNALNFITFGTLDKAVLKLMQLTMEIIVGIMLGLFVVVPILGGTLLGGGVTNTADKIASGSLRAPNSDWVPDTVGLPPVGVGETGSGTEYPPGVPTDPRTSEPIDWSKYAKYSSNACPVQTSTGLAVTYCSQGPRGIYSHAGATPPGHFAIDLAGSSVVYAPADGVIANATISCRVSCETSTGYNNPKLTAEQRAIIGATKLPECQRYVNTYGYNVLGLTLTTTTGEKYLFWHVIVDTTSLQFGQSVTKGTRLGVAVVGASACSSGTHVHFEKIGDQNPDAAYTVMCKLGTPLKCSD